MFLFLDMGEWSDWSNSPNDNTLCTRKCMKPDLQYYRNQPNSCNQPIFNHTKFKCEGQPNKYCDVSSEKSKARKFVKLCN